MVYTEQRVAELEKQLDFLRQAQRQHAGEHVKLISFALAFQHWLDNGMPGGDSGHPSAERLFDAYLLLDLPAVAA